MKSSVFNNQGVDNLCKIILVGDSGVGKTSLLIRYLDDQFYESSLQNSTISVDFRFKDLMVDNKKIRLQFWDTAGQERYKSMNASYYRGAAAVLVVYSVDDPESLEGASNWVNEVKDEIGTSGELILVGTKVDLERRVDRSSATDLEQKESMTYFQVSARSGDGIQQLFELLAQKLLENSQEGNSLLTTTKLMPDIQSQTKRCQC